MSGSEASPDSSQRRSPVEKLREETEEALSGKPMDEESRKRSVFGRLDKVEGRVEKLEKRRDGFELNAQTVRNAALIALVTWLASIVLPRLGGG